MKAFQPTKKPKGRELSLQERTANRLISPERIGIAHSLGGVKVCRIVSDGFRHVRDGFDDLAREIACGLPNFRIDPPVMA